MLTILRFLLLSGACLLGWTQAIANCLPSVPPPTFYVGSDNQCDYATIQAAISAVSTSATCAPNIVITNEIAWTAQHLSIDNRSLNLIGSSSGCGIGGTTGISAMGDIPDKAIPAPKVTISGAGQTSASVISITGNSNVTLKFLQVSGGNRAGFGGGIFFGGAGSLTLDTSTISANQASYGGGIAMAPSGSATLTLLANSLVKNNVATVSGGGVLIEGDTHLILVANQTQLFSNTANNGYGGGLYIVGPAHADIGSPGDNTHGTNNAGVIANNSAAYGGGIAAFGSSSAANQDAVVNLFTTDAQRPVNLQANIASINGGAIYLKPYQNSSFRSAAKVCAFNFRIDANSAAEGAAIYLDSFIDPARVDFGGIADLNTDSVAGCNGDEVAGFAAVACADDAPCNALSGNIAQDTNLNPTNRAIIFSGSGASVFGSHISLLHNNGGYVIHAINNGGITDLISSLLADNQVTQQLILGESAFFDIENSTFANNSIGADHVFKITDNSYLTLLRSIIYEPGKPTLDRTNSSGSNIDYILSNDITTLTTHPGTVVSGDPKFVDVTNGNYRLRAYRQNGNILASPAIDFMAAGNPGDDLDGNPEDQAVPLLWRTATPHDLGAYEAQPILDRVFGDGFGDAVSLVH
ncbi:hypothetical protein ELE36_14380 [Pseudolysobacter antarcticus]|uniref:CSLREA domain-containing protein n=1 Tax=Pseudolysobacter antarcticus TaxID=2511995 RepID=A0A411HLT1_9GAMM|nr:hypothetical protein [Pseudolysobacter antarcticus]QBB71448.1 hypothetical protein ELE36_14380 [Pseudolysobacter antarcticus]